MPFSQAPRLVGGATWRPIGIARLLTVVVLLTAGPLLILSLIVANRMLKSERQFVHAGLVASSRALAAAVEAEIGRHVAIVRTMADSRSLSEGQFEAFRDEALSVLALTPGSQMLVADPDGRQLLNTLFASGAPLPRRRHLDLQQTAFATGRYQVSGVRLGPTSSQHSIEIEMPVFRNGSPFCILVLAIHPEHFAKLIRSQAYSEGSRASIIDADGRFVARLIDHHKHLGTLASADWREAIRRTPEGVVEVASLDGSLVTSAYRPAGHGWTVGVALTNAVLERAASRNRLLLVLLGACLTGLALMGASVAARQIIGAARALNASSADVSVAPTGIVEFDAIAMQLKAERDRQRGNEERFRTLAAMSSDWYWEQDAKFRFTNFSSSVATLAGSSAGSHYGKTRWELPVVGVTEAQWAAHRAALERREPFRGFEYQRLNEAGETIWMTASGDPVFAPDGTFAGYRGTGTNITARKRSETLLAEHKHLLEMIARGAPLSECLVALTGAVARLNASTRACVLLASPDRMAMVDSYSSTIPKSFGDAICGASIREIGIGMCGTSFWDRRPVTCPDIADDDSWSPMWRDLCVEHGIRACHAKPVLARDGHALASFFLAFSEARQPSEWELRLAEFGTHVASIAIERDATSSALKAIQAQNLSELHDSRLLQALGAELIRERDPSALYERLVEGAMTIMHADYASLQMLERTNGHQRLRLLAYRGLPAAAAQFWQMVAPEHASTCGVALRTRDRVICENVVAAEWMAGTADLAAYLDAGIRAVQTTPLMSRDGVLLGMLSTHWQMPHVPSDRELRLLDILARQAADVIDQAHSANALRDSEGRYRSALAAGRLGSWETDFVRGTRRWTPESMRLLGVSPPDGIGRVGGPDDEWLNALVPEDRSIGKQLWALAHEQDSFPAEYRVRLPDGSVRWLSGRGEVKARTGDGRPKLLVSVMADVTERRLAEEQLRARDAVLRTVTEGAGVGFYMIDREFRYTFANAAYLETLGLEPRDITGAPVAEVVGEARCAAVRPMHERVLAGENVMFERQGPADLATRPHAEHRLVHLQPFRDGHGTVTGIIGVVLDITARKTSEDALRRSEERYRNLVGVITDVPWIVDDEGSFASPQSAWAEYTGQGWNEHRGLGWVTALHPADRERVMGLWKTARETGSYEAQGRIWHAKTGSHRHFVARAAPVRDQNDVIREWVGSCTDVHEREVAAEQLRESEERYRILTELAPQIVFLAEPDGRVIYLNKWGLTYTGRSLEALRSDGWEELIEPSHRHRMLATWRRSMESGTAYNAEIRLRRASDGVYRWLAAHGLPVRDETGQIAKWIGVAFDIHDRKLAEQRQELLLRELAHRGKNLLAVVQSIASRTLRSKGDSADRAALLARLQSLSRTYSTLTVGSFEGASIGTLVANELGAFAERLSVEGPDLVLNDKAAQTFALMLHELATNAAKHGAWSRPDGRVTVAWTINHSSTGEELLFIWQEGDGGGAETPAQVGFGTSGLVEREVK